MTDSIRSAALGTFSRHVNAPYTAFLRRVGLEQEFVRAEGAIVYDRAGRSFVDCIAGYGNLNLGHNPPEVLEAVIEELQSLRPYNWPFVSQAHARLAEKLAGIFPGELECSLVVNSGAEAVDSALKLARLATRKSKIIAMHGAWHGFTLGALSVSEKSMCRSFEPLLEGVRRVPYAEVQSVAAAIDEQTGAVIVEPIQAENGAIVPPAGYLRDLAVVCRERDALLIFDEIKTGMGKTGRLFACQHDDAIPDILLAGKSLGGGVMPIGVMVARRKLWGSFGYSFPMSSSSSAGNAPACAAACAALDLIQSSDLCVQAAAHGQRLARALAQLCADHPTVIKGWSGRGLLMALHAGSLTLAAEILSQCIRRGILVMRAFCDPTRILIEPPLCISDVLLERVISTLNEAVAAAKPSLRTGAALAAARQPTS